MLVALAILAPSLTTGCANTSLHPDLDQEMLALASLEESALPNVLQNLAREDSIGDYYRDPTTRAATQDFFETLTGSRTVAQAVLENAERYDVPPALAFALAYEESKFKADAMHRNGDSVDRGLFQLNSKSFPKLEVSAFYDPRISAKYGISHLQFLLDQAGNEVTALAMYNAGNGSVTRGRTPKKTLDYVYRILKYQENITSLFAARVIVGPRLKEAAQNRARLTFAGIRTSLQ